MGKRCRPNFSLRNWLVIHSSLVYVLYLFLINEVNNLGACSVVVAGVLTGRSERGCVVSLPGGDLHINWNENDNRLYMTGPAELSFKGFI